MSQKKLSNISNSTPNAATKKTVSAHKFLRWPFLLTAAALFVGLLCLAVLTRNNTTVTLDGHAYQVDVADTDDARQKGLGGTTSLLPGHGMLFVFHADSPWVFWMKDMHYAIDIVWLDAAKHVVARVHATPDSYPHTFTPPKPARYVLELPSEAAAHVKQGDAASF
jgi:uncharacterized membrane protein (UPF0127 family)